MNPSWASPGCPCVSSARSEPLLNFVHQRVGKPGLPQCGKILKNEGYPGFPVLHILLTLIASIECPRLFHTAKKHERTGAVHVEQYCAGRGGVDQVGGFECLRKITRQDKANCQIANPSDAELKIAPPFGI